MSLAQITLTTNKTVSNVGDYIRKIGQGERGQVLPVVVTDANGAAYDLTNKSIVFSENKDSGKYVVDDGKASTSGKFTLTDPQNGKFSYTLQEQVYPESGTAWFDIVSADGTVLDTTVSFRFVVIPAPTLHVNDDNYSSTLEALQAHYQGVIKNTETQTQNLINSLTDKINRAISNGQNDIANELSDARTKLQAIQD
ncbi:BppU family phage baseplate upper protein, partial [uncultured Lactobacillus sp.]|uniref:BppU family phage baseplate upper protein n=1 Tax=uncultured Lactobacillus sp. TaxID=153152 RepID=UPI0026235A90